MRKYLIILLSAICACCVAFAFGCSSHTHTWVATEEVDEEGNTIYVCSDCGETHEHTFGTTYSYDSSGHWLAATCGHSDAKSGFSEHVYESDDDTVCSVCGYDKSVEATYNIEFSYYQYDDDGNIVTESSDDTTYVTVDVTYTAVLSSSDFLVDVENGDSVMAGDVISFTVVKSVFDYYTDGGSAPVVYVNDEVIEADSNGVYSFTVAADMASSDGNLIVWVSNVEMMPETISGGGTASNPYTINSVTDWLYFATYINEDFYNTMNYAYWALGCDLDFEGEQIYMVGDGYTTTGAYFMGNFNGNGYTLSNFVLSNEISGTVDTYTSYLGVFGVCSVIEGYSPIITNLNLENFTMEATCPSDGTCVVGAIAGYSVGYSITNCKVSGGEIVVNGSSSYSSLVGGVVGYMQSYYFTDSSTIYYAAMQYVEVSDMDISGSGIIYAEGGLVGYLSAYSESATAYIINSYASNISVSDGIFTGGLVGLLGRYSSVQNSYATGTVYAVTTFTTTDSEYTETELDYRYARAGGIAGYAENDTYIGGCFFVGTTGGSAASGSSRVRKGEICADCSAAGFEEYYASALIMKNNLTASDVSSDNLKKIGWSTVDWDFSGTYPVVNTATGSVSYTITLKISDGTTTVLTSTVAVDSTNTNTVYIPMTYRYILGDSNSAGGISIYVRDGYLRTYGYFFDEACTERVPAGYVPMGDIMLYAEYADCTNLVDKEYYLSGNGVSATIVFDASGTYTYEEGAVYVTGSYEYDGTTITFKNSYFSRLSADATDDQTATYYTFYATIENGDLLIFDGEDIVTDTDYDYLARFFTKDNPLKAVAEGNVTFSGSYYGSDGLDYVINKNYTGTYSASGSSDTYNLTYTVTTGSTDTTVTITMNARTYTGTLDSDGKLTIITYVKPDGNSSNDTTTLTAYDAFKGTWEQAGLVSKVYTFDGKGGWTYTDGSVNESGTYAVDTTAGTATFIRNSISVTVTVNADGTLNVSEAKTNDVTLFVENSLAGVWYTAAENETRYTLTLSGINSNGYGTAEYGGVSDYRYCVSSANDNYIILYMYYGDTQYASLTYTVKDGSIYGLFYNSSTDSYDTSYTFYQYDNYYGSWVGSIDAFKTISFNGFGMYNVAKTSNKIAVNGTATLNGSATVSYSVDRSTGAATFTYNEVEYTLAYDEYTGAISVSYSGSVAKIAKADMYADVVFETDAGTTYSFDGRGSVGAGVVTIINGTTTTTASYSLSGTTITISGNASGEIKLGSDGYVLNSSTELYVQNSFTGTWAVNKMYTELVINNLRYVYTGADSVTVTGTYGSESITLSYNGSTMSFKVGSTTYYVSDIGNGLVLSTTETYTASTYYYLSEPDDIYGTWTNGTTTFTFDGSLNSYYVSRYNHAVTMTVNGTLTEGYYYLDGSVYYVVFGNTTYKFTVASTSSDGAYISSSHSGSYLVPYSS